MYLFLDSCIYICLIFLVRYRTKVPFIPLEATRFEHLNSQFKNRVIIRKRVRKYVYGYIYPQYVVCLRYQTIAKTFGYNMITPKKVEIHIYFEIIECRNFIPSESHEIRTRASSDEPTRSSLLHAKMSAVGFVWKRLEVEFSCYKI